MTTEQQTTSRATRREVYRYVAELEALPAPTRISVNETNGVIFLSFETFADVEAWADAMKVPDYNRSQRRVPDDNGCLSTYYSFDGGLLGYHGALTCHEPAPGEWSVLDEPAVAYDSEDPNAPKAGA